MAVKRKGYASIDKQVEANQRYLKNNPDAKLKQKISVLKSSGKRFVLEYANLEELEQFENFITERKNILKNL